MNAAELMDHLLSRGVDIVAEDGRLRVGAARGQLSDETKKLIFSYKKELLDLLERRSAKLAEVSTTDISPRLENERPPLSFAQERLWFLGELDPGSALYNIPVALSLDGALDVAALQRSLDEVVRRHEALRTRFETVAGRPVQVV
ncbi:MAG: condensation domain-containing protein, partial [Steroidobacteraceae bacterium]